MHPVSQFLGLTVLLVVASASAQTVWKWKDKNGVTHYSDQSVPGAERVELNVQTYASPPATPAASVQKDTPLPPPSYTNLEIWKPGPETTITGTGGQVSIGIRVEPGLAAGHVLSLFMDGRRVEGSPNATEYDLNNVNRGQHTAVAVIADSKGKQVRVSKPVTFYVQRPTVLNPK